MSTPDQAWHLKYRPTCFEEVVGQKTATAYLSGLVRKRKARTFMLHGPWGTGKTTLARLYAKGLQCEAPRPAGSPCLTCDQCRWFDEGRTDYIELDGSAAGGVETSRKLIEIVKQPPLFSGWRVIVIDEAQGLTRKGSDALLKTVEEPSSRTVFILATTEPSEVRRPLWSRFIKVEVRPTSDEEAFDHLVFVCGEEKIAYEDQALRVLVALSRGHVRDLLMNLEQVAEFGPVTVEAIIEIMALDQGPAMVRYFDALLAGDLHRQLGVMHGWARTANEKITHVLGFLNHLYGKEIHEPRFEVLDPGFMTVTEADRRRIADGLRERAARHGIDAAALWQELGLFWTQWQPAGDVLLHTAVCQFDRVVNVKPIPAGWMKGPPLAIPASPSTMPEPVTPRKPRRPFWTPKVTPFVVDLWAAQQAAEADLDPADEGAVEDHGRAYLPWQTVQEFFDAASYQIQEFGLLFNTRMRIDHARLGHSEPLEASDFTGHLTKELRQRLTTWAPGVPEGKFPRIVLLERAPGEGGGLQTRIVAHIPCPLRARVAEWLYGDFLPNRGLKVRRRDVWFETKWPHSRAERLAEHWSAVRSLCLGLNPHTLALDGPDEATAQYAYLADLLGVPEKLRRPAGDIGRARRYVIAPEINASAREADAAERLAPLSPFEDRAWSRLDDGWEFYEHPLRRQAKTGALQSLLCRLYPKGLGALHDARHDEELRRWLDAERPVDPRRRPGRNWAVWW